MRVLYVRLHMGLNYGTRLRYNTYNSYDRTIPLYEKVEGHPANRKIGNQN